VKEILETNGFLGRYGTLKTAQQEAAKFGANGNFPKFHNSVNNKKNLKKIFFLVQNISRCGLDTIETHSKWYHSLNTGNLGPNTLTNSLNTGNLASNS
jgi:hypothetical protein